MPSARSESPTLGTACFNEVDQVESRYGSYGVACIDVRSTISSLSINASTCAEIRIDKPWRPFEEARTLLPGDHAVGCCYAVPTLG